MVHIDANSMSTSPYMLRNEVCLQLEYASSGPASSASSVASPVRSHAVEQPMEQSAPPAQRASEASPSESPSTPESPGLALAETLAASLAESLTVPKQHDSNSKGGAFTVSDLQALYQSKVSEIQEGAWAADFASAMAAVDQTDVLAEESPFASVKRQVCFIYNEQHATSHVVRTAFSSLPFVIEILKEFSKFVCGQRQHEEGVMAGQMPSAFLVEAEAGGSTGEVQASRVWSLECASAI